MMNNVVLAASEHLRVVFDRRGDRWGHRIEHVVSGEPVQTLGSIEGTIKDLWPPSPAFHTLEIQTESVGGQVVLLVGKAGSSHWSAAVEANSAAEAITFDVACRFQIQPEFLGSQYSAVMTARVARSSIPRLNFFSTKIGDEIAFENNDEKQICLLRVITSDGPLPRTARWRYVVSRRSGVPD